MTERQTVALFNASEPNMNVNLTPSLDTSKVAKPTSTQETVSEDSGEEKGFLDKLASFVFGEKNTTAAEAKSAEQSEVESAKNHAIDSLSVQDETSASDAEELGESDELVGFISGDMAQELPDLKKRAAQAMSDGDELLGRLHEANQTLADSKSETSDGKALPQEEQTNDVNLGQESSSPSGSSAIQWGKPNADGSVAETNVKPGQHSLATHSQAAQALAMTDKAVPAQGMDSDTAEQPQLQTMVNMQSSPLFANAMAGQADTITNQAFLKTGLDEKALASMSDVSKSGSGADLAQQLSAAAGQHGVNGLQANIRNESLQAQQPNMPLQLARADIAADQMAERVQVMLSKNLKNIDIRLDPPELGRMQIRMNMNGDSATVQFTVANQQARDVLEHSMPRLREMLSNQGVQLGETSVQQQSSGQQEHYAASGHGSGGQSASGDILFGEENLDTDVKLDLNVAAKRDGISYYA